jgi:hypothetical protein
VVNCLDNVYTCNIIYFRSSDSVVRAIEGDRARWEATPCEVLIVADNRHDLRIHVGNGEDHFISAKIESIIAAAGYGAIILSHDACRSADG